MRTREHTHPRACTHTHTHTHTPRGVCEPLSVNNGVCVCVCVCVCMCVCVCVCTLIPSSVPPRVLSKLMPSQREAGRLKRSGADSHAGLLRGGATGCGVWMWAREWHVWVCTHQLSKVSMTQHNGIHACYIV